MTKLPPNIEATLKKLEQSQTTARGAVEYLWPQIAELIDVTAIIKYGQLQQDVVDYVRGSDRSRLRNALDRAKLAIRMAINAVRADKAITANELAKHFLSELKQVEGLENGTMP